jgi:hypothetical protein
MLDCFAALAVAAGKLVQGILGLNSSLTPNLSPFYLFDRFGLEAEYEPESVTHPVPTPTWRLPTGLGCGFGLRDAGFVCDWRL